MTEENRNLKKEYEEATIKTVSTLNNEISLEELQKLSQLTLPEITTIADLVAKLIPAGNLTGMILNGLARLSGRKMPIEKVREDIHGLFTGIEQYLDRAVYAAFFAGPAAVIWGYQNLLTLTGRTPDDAFPEGIWQFYVDYAMREDTARHANETHGFYSTLRKENIKLDKVDFITAWTMTAVQALHNYADLLENEWYERITTFILTEVTATQRDASYYADLYREWEKQRPYGLPANHKNASESYADYRRAQFEYFLERETRHLDDEIKRQWREKLRINRVALLKNYLKQMSIHTYLHADIYGEERRILNLRETNIALIYRGHYYLIPTCRPNSNKPADLETIRGAVAAMIANPSNKPPAGLTRYVQVKRSVLPDLREKLHHTIIAEIDKLKTAPIIINCDIRPHDVPLTEIRNGERGAGDHAITIFHTAKTTVFDESHIFFDGAWGSALAEIMTQEAVQWARKLNAMPTSKVSEKRPYRALIYFDEPDLNQLALKPRVNVEGYAENDQTNLRTINTLRRLLQHRNEKLKLTVNDIMVLYRAIHSATYKPAMNLEREVRENLVRDPKTNKAAAALLKLWDPNQNMPPAIVIPIDASKRSPRDRLYPMTFDVPLSDLKILDLHQKCLAALDRHQASENREEREELYNEFQELQLTYLAMLAGFGEVMNKAKSIAIANETVTAATAKLIGGLPVPLQRLLEQIPERFDILNDIIKGREIFSNVGQVVPSSTLVRFNTAKDDSDRKTLCWGILTDSNGVLKMSLRDFRPHIALLAEAGRKDLAQEITQDYLNNYVKGINQFVKELKEIAEATRGEATPSSRNQPPRKTMTLSRPATS